MASPSTAPSSATHRPAAFLWMCLERRALSRGRFMVFAPGWARRCDRWCAPSPSSGCSRALRTCGRPRSSWRLARCAAPRAAPASSSTRTCRACRASLPASACPSSLRRAALSRSSPSTSSSGTTCRKARACPSSGGWATVRIDSKPRASSTRRRKSSHPAGCPSSSQPSGRREGRSAPMEGTSPPAASRSSRTRSGYASRSGTDRRVSSSSSITSTRSSPRP
mmetsp:Transcript_29215/g.93439  ORF Transcript_29215/g.93439 Transcript_29215/m.93439 type:complete len:223 (-) Transcript_29215:65-733(-)